MKTIKEHNDMVLRQSGNKNLTNVECPNCKSELQFTHPGRYMLSSPMQADVKCYECNYSTRIYVS